MNPFSLSQSEAFVVSVVMVSPHLMVECRKTGSGMGMFSVVSFIIAGQMRCSRCKALFMLVWLCAMYVIVLVCLLYFLEGSVGFIVITVTPYVFRTSSRNVDRMFICAFCAYCRVPSNDIPKYVMLYVLSSFYCCFLMIN